jgi:hypothetical protein
VNFDVCLIFREKKNAPSHLMFFSIGEITNARHMFGTFFSRLDEAVALIMLYHIVNPEAKSVSAKFEPGLEHKYIQVMLHVVYLKC